MNDNGDLVPAKVLKRVRDNDGKPIGKPHTNPLVHDTRAYDGEMHDGTIYGYNVTVIATNIFSQCKNEGRQHAVMQEITDHSKANTAVNITNG